MEKIILYGLNDERTKQIHELLNNHGFENIKFISNEMSNCITGFLHDLDGYTPDRKDGVTAPEIEFMMISGFDGERINQLVSAFKTNQIERPVTSALTPSNKDWIFADLVNEVYEEHLYMTSQMNNQK